MNWGAAVGAYLGVIILGAGVLRLIRKKRP
jgi:hypothetical protein